MTRVLHCFILFILVASTSTLYVPPRQMTDDNLSHHVVIGLISVKPNEMDGAAVRKASSEAKRFDLRTNGNILVEKRSEKKPSIQWHRQRKLRPRSDSDDDPNAAGSDASRDEEEATAVKMQRPAQSEYLEYLTEEEKADFQRARGAKSQYSKDRKMTDTILDHGGKIPNHLRERLRYGKDSAALYSKLRRRAIKRLVDSGNARPEVVAYWRHKLKGAAKKTLASYAQLPEAEKKLVQTRKAAVAREKRALRRARIAELEVKARDEQITDQERSELAGLKAELGRDSARKKERYENLSDEDKRALNDKATAGRRQKRERERAEKEAIETRIEAKTATSEDEQRLVEIEQQWEAERAYGREAYNKHKAKKQRPQETTEAEGATEGKDDDDDSELSTTTTTDASSNPNSASKNPPVERPNEPSNNGPLQFSNQPSRLENLQIHAAARNGLDNLQQTILAVPKAAWVGLTQRQPRERRARILGANIPLRPLRFGMP